LASTLRMLRDRPGCALALISVAIYLNASSGHGYFPNELYFIVRGDRQDWGYADQPPL